MNEHIEKIETLVSNLNSDIQNGLSASQVITKKNEFGENKLVGKKKKTLLQRFLAQFEDIMIIILLIAALISLVVAINGHDVKEFFEPALILLIVILNSILGVVQESKAEKSLEALQNMSAPNARVLRNSKEQLIPSSELVPGDIIIVEAGSFVPADARLITSANLSSEEAALTGESLPSEKDANAIIDEKAPIGDRINMIYSGCSITYGRGTAIVTGTGMNTQMGKIANMLNDEGDSLTPLQQKLLDLGKKLGLLALLICVIIFVIGIVDGMPLLEIFMTAVSLAVSAIPEGLPAIVTIVLSIGVTRMVKRNAIIRKLPAVETLGSANVICSDKTGTLTQNRMTLVKAYVDSSAMLEDISSNNSEDTRNLLKLATLCCDGSITMQDGKETFIGDPTETSIVYAAQINGMKKDDLTTSYKRIAELPFDSVRKLMTTVVEMDGKIVVITKGAFDSFSHICTKGDLLKASAIVNEWSENALRVIAVAYKIIDVLPEHPSFENLETDLTLIGLVGMIDPHREEAKEAVKLCREAGIKPVMITGDHIITASAIAKELGILLDGDYALLGSELQNMSEEDLLKDVEHISVYARVSPEDKIRIVKAWQTKGAIVSMTGDGVNDAPALKAADIGCAMGITGTDVAKGTADMILMDDNFATIVEAVKEGRGIYDNIKKSVTFLLGTNIGEIVVVFLSMILFKVSPLLSMQLLWINLVTDSLPAIALGMEAVDKDIMKKAPKHKNESIFANGLGLQIVLQGILFGILTIIAFFIGRLYTLETGRTMAFITLSFSQLFHSFNTRSYKSIFKIGIFSNKNLNLAFLISGGLTLMVIFVPPISMVFGLVGVSTNLYLTAFILSFIPIIILECVKFLGLLK